VLGATSSRLGPCTLQCRCHPLRLTPQGSGGGGPWHSACDVAGD